MQIIPFGTRSVFTNIFQFLLFGTQSGVPNFLTTMTLISLSSALKDFTIILWGIKQSLNERITILSLSLDYRILPRYYYKLSEATLVHLYIVLQTTAYRMCLIPIPEKLISNYCYSYQISNLFCQWPSFSK